MVAPRLIPRPLRRQLQQSSDEHSLSARTFNAQYLGELVKFKVLSFPAAFKCLKALLDDLGMVNVQARPRLGSVCVMLHRSR